MTIDLPCPHCHITLHVVDFLAKQYADTGKISGKCPLCRKYHKIVSRLEGCYDLILLPESQQYPEVDPCG